MRKGEGMGGEKIFYRGESKRRLKENFHRFSIMDPDRVADGVRPVFKPLPPPPHPLYANRFVGESSLATLVHRDQPYRHHAGNVDFLRV